MDNSDNYPVLIHVNGTGAEMYSALYQSMRSLLMKTSRSENTIEI
jgi:hypothetical protein